MKVSNLKVSNRKVLILLQLLICYFSVIGILSKKASTFPVLSMQFIAIYSTILLMFFVYAVLWQQILKRVTLTTAFISRSSLVIWSLVWSVLFFGESVSVKNLIGAVIIVLGIMVVANDDK